MKLVSILVGTPKVLQFKNTSVKTSIFKESIFGPVEVNKMNIVGDRQSDLRVHGGFDKAVYAYSLDAYENWHNHYGKYFEIGSFGENLIIDSFNEGEMGIGDIYQLGTTVLQIVQPRVPCYKLAVRLNDISSLKSFNKIQRPGIYFRVIMEGEIESGQKLVLLKKEDVFVSVLDLFKLTIQPAEKDLLENILKIKSLNSNWRTEIEFLIKGKHLHISG